MQNIIEKDFIMYWSYSVNGSITLMFKIVDCDWFGVAFNTSSMANADMLVFRISTLKDTGKVVTVHDMQGV